MSLNWPALEFWLFGPLPIWVLAIGVILTAVLTATTWYSNTRKIIASLERATCAFEKITKELSKDTSELRTATSELNEELRLTRKSTQSLQKLLRRFYETWFPFTGTGGESTD